MRKILITIPALLMLFITISNAQSVERPKLVVGIVADQMRWDYLYRYFDRYTSGGFKRMLTEGFSCENTFIPYVPTITACGHSTIYTGSVPALSGISGNNWWDKDQNKLVYCTEDNSVTTVGSTSKQGKMSPRNMLVSTIGDELRLATNFRSKVVGIAIKDRGSILPAGHSANAAYWYDNSTGDWISSSYYMNELPGWVKDFNKQKLVDHYFQQGWHLLYPADTYLQSTADEKKYEGKSLGSKFPYDLKKFIGKEYGKLTSTPYGNIFTAEFAKAAIVNENLGADAITDFLTISFSTPDYIGHTFGPNSMEAEDGFLRLDKEMENLFTFLDNRIGRGQYTVFLSADHGASQVPEFLQENKLPAGRVHIGYYTDSLNKMLKEKYRIDKIILSDENYQLHLNHRALDSAGVNNEEITQWIINRFSEVPGIFRVFELDDLNEVPMPSRLREMINNGYNPRRNGTIQIILYPHYFESGASTGTSHGSWNPYDAHIPLVWYGWGIKPGKTNRETYMTDIAPTLAALLHIQMPSGCVGNVIEEVQKK